MFTRYFQQELEFLRQLGREFAREHPTLAPFLADLGSDPDVERVLEGTAFLTGAIRQKLEDDLPELMHTLLDMLCPHYLRPIPSTTIVEFVHPEKPRVASTQRIAATTTELESVPVDGTPCRFRTTSDVSFHPLRLVQASLESGGRGALRLRLEWLANAKPDELRLDPLRLHLHGDLPTASTLWLWLLRHVEAVEIEVPRKSGPPTRSRVVGRPATIRPVGLGETDALLPYPPHSFPGYRLLQEYFTLPQKFLFVDVAGIPPLASLEPEGGFELWFRFRERPPESLRVSTDNVRLHCTPAVNLLSCDAEPIRLDHRQSSYYLRPADRSPDHFEVYTVDRVEGLAHGTGERREYLPFNSFRHGMAADDRAVYYTMKREPAVGRPNSDCSMGFVTVEARGTLPQVETLSVGLTCTNRRLSEGLKPGDVRRHVETSPQFAEFRNIGPLTVSVLPPLQDGFLWRLVSHLSLNLSSLQSPEALRGVLSLYDFHALHDRQAARASQLRLEAISSVSSRAADRVFRGTPMRGIATRIELVEERFASEGELYLFGSVLEEFLALYVTVNAFSQLTVRGASHGEIYEWPARVGRQFIL